MLYLVRMNRDLEDKSVADQIVGIFSATSIEALWSMVDEVTSPVERQYARLLGDGGIVWPGRAVTFAAIEAWADKTEYDVGEHPLVKSLKLHTIDFTEGLHSSLLDGLKFKRFDTFEKYAKKITT